MFGWGRPNRAKGCKKDKEKRGKFTESQEKANCLKILFDQGPFDQDLFDQDPFVQDQFDQDLFDQGTWSVWCHLRHIQSPSPKVRTKESGANYYADQS